MAADRAHMPWISYARERSSRHLCTSDKTRNFNSERSAWVIWKYRSHTTAVTVSMGMRLVPMCSAWNNLTRTTFLLQVIAILWLQMVHFLGNCSLLKLMSCDFNNLGLINDTYQWPINEILTFINKNLKSEGDICLKIIFPRQTNPFSISILPMHSTWTVAAARLVII
jgi:hypothetical protein